MSLARVSFWLNTDRPAVDARVLWVGAGTKDTGLSLTQLIFQITHATDADTNAERDHIIGELTKGRVIQPMERVNRYITDGEVTLANPVNAR